MPQFDAESIVDPLRVRMEPYVPGFGWRVIPEPTDQQVGEFLAALKNVIAEARKQLEPGKEVDIRDREQVMEAMEDLDPADFVRVADEMAGIHAALCAGPPGTQPALTKEHLLAVPLRMRNQFFAWLQGEVLNPEVAPGGGSEQVTTLPPAAAG